MKTQKIWERLKEMNFRDIIIKKVKVGGTIQMNKLLVDTHRKENIEFLKARDYYFNKARDLSDIRNF